MSDSEKKRGFFGRLFGGKKADAPQDEAPRDAPEDDLISPTPDVPDVADEHGHDAHADAAIADQEKEADALADDVPLDGADSAAEPADDIAGDGEPIVDAPALIDAADAAEVPEAEVREAEDRAEPVARAPEEPVKKLSWFQRLKQGLSRSSSALGDSLSGLLTKRKLDEDLIQDLEDILVQADLGVDTAMAITDKLAESRYNKEITADEVRTLLAEEVEAALTPVAKPLDVACGHKPHIILMVGVNGTGKTTTIGKLAAKFKAEGKSVMLAAGDTFRAAAIEQLKVWGERTDTRVIARETGADASGLAYDAIEEAQAAGVDILMIDTAGRLQNKTELMAELEKVIRVIRKLLPEAPHDVLLVLDATTGQNAMSQAEIFGKTAGVTGLVMTKLDGTARGGILVALAAKFGLPVHFIGVGEGIDDLEPFKPDEFARAIAGLADEEMSA